MLEDTDKGKRDAALALQYYNEYPAGLEFHDYVAPRAVMIFGKLQETQVATSMRWCHKRFFYTIVPFC